MRTASELVRLISATQEALAFEIEQHDAPGVIAATQRKLNDLLKEQESVAPVTYQVWAVNADGTERIYYGGKKFKAAQKRMDEVLEMCRSGQIEGCVKVQLRDNIHGEFLNFVTQHVDGHPGW